MPAQGGATGGSATASEGRGVLLRAAMGQCMGRAVVYVALGGAALWGTVCKAGNGET